MKRIICAFSDSAANAGIDSLLLWLYWNQAELWR